MKSISKLTILFFLAFLTLTASAEAQSPREQLAQLVEQLQKAPNDNALREKIIKLAISIKPAPAIPEEAREPFVMGATVLKKASDPAGASKAVDLFTQALTIAPWFSEAYYNRALARETAGQFEPAMDDLKLYLEFKLTDTERREAQDKIYSLKADAQLASAKKSEEVKAAAAKAAANTPQALEAALLQKVEGARFVNDRNRAPSTHFSYDDILEIKGGILYRSIRIYSMGSGNALVLSFKGHDQPGLYSAESAPYRDGAFTIITCVYRIRPDGKALLKRCSNYQSNDPDDAILRQ
jgi:tetratricopeptide (TPR) repeat protein